MDRCGQFAADAPQVRQAPSFATVLKVARALGVKLHAKAVQAAHKSEAYPFEGTSSFWQAVFVFVVEGLGADSRLMQEQAALKGMNDGADCFCEDGLVALSA